MEEKMKSINKFFMVAMVMLILFSVSSVFAVQNETIMTDDANDALTIDDEIISSSEDNDLLSDTGNYNDLQGKIDAGGNVSLDKDYQYVDGGYDSISIGKSVVVDGHGHYIDAKGKTGIFNSHKNGGIDVVLKNIIFKNAKTENGGALHFTVKNSKFTIINCTFLNDGAREDGGAINCQYSNLIIDGCTFNSNYAYRCGGAIYFEGDDNSLSLSNCQFDSNQANRYGGAIYIDGKVDVFKHSSFNKNLAYNHGGAVYVKSNHEKDFIVDSCPFVENQVKGDGLKGGAIYNCGPGTVTFRNSDFSDNMGSNEGGAIYSSETIKIDACNFTRNKAHDNGGAIFADVIDWADSTSIFTRNQVAHDNMVSANKGGAIYAQKFGNTAKRLVFDQNWAYYGGAIYINSKGNANIESSLFVGNVATHADGTAGCGAAIYMDSASAQLTLRYNIFVGNNAHEDKAVYNCGKYESVEYNWWGNNNPDFSQPYLVEWHRFTSNDKHSDSHPLSVVLSWSNEPTSKFENGTINVKFVTKEGMDLADKMDGYVASLTSDKKATIKATDKKYNFTFTPLEAGQYAVTLQMSNEWGTLLGGGGTIHTNITGDFALLQKLVDDADGVLNLTHDFTYSIGVDTITDGIVINKPLTINGNGHTIDALTNSRIFKITSDGVTINNVTLKNGKASEGGAIRWIGLNGKVSNSIFLNNTASVKNMTVQKEIGTLVFTLTGNENYINAIYSDNDLSFSNVTYWNGTAKTNATPVKSDVIANGNIFIFIKDSNGILIKIDNAFTDENGKATYNYLSILEEGNYTFKAGHYDDSYYATKEVTGSLEVSHIAPNNSSVEITTANGTEFNYESINIEFRVWNRTDVKVSVTDVNCTKIIYEGTLGGNQFSVNLPASDEYYNVTVYNLGNETTNPSKDSILIKVNKVPSYIQITAAPGDFNYSATSGISFEGNSDCHNYNVTIYDENNQIAYSEIVWVANTQGSMSIPVLDAGRYTINVTNLGNENRKENTASATFNILKINNNCSVSVDNNVYGRDITVTVRASIDGEYIVKINSTTVTVNVVDGVGSAIIEELNAGYYTANVTSAKDNYNNNATNDTFTIEKAQSNVRIVDMGDVAWNTTKTIRFSDFYPAEYVVTIHDSGNNRVYYDMTNSLLFTIPVLDAGQYKLTVTNIGNDNVLFSQDSCIFEVVRENHVEVFAEDADYGREVFIGIIADVDGYYTVNLNGTEVTIEVIDGEGVYYGLLDLNAGNYTTKVIYDNPDYTTIVNNTNFTIYIAESNLKIYEIGNVTYGGDINIRFYDDYPTTFHIAVFYENGTVAYETDFKYTDQRKDMSVIFADLPVGEYMVYIVNLGDENVIGSDSHMYFNVTELPGSIVASDLTRVYNSGMDFTAKLVDENGTGIANKTVTFIINGKNYTAVTNANGVANINPKLAVGTYTVQVVNPFNNVKTNKTLKIVTRITGNKNVNTYYGKNYQYKLRIIGDDGKAVGAGVSVKVTINGKAQTLKTDKNGYITVKFTKNYLPKTYTVKAEYKGIKVSNKIKVKKVLTLKKVKVKRSAKKLVLKATLKEGKKALKGKKVVFKFKGKKYTAKTNKKGLAKVTIKKKVLKKLKKGKKVKYQVTYLKHTVKRTAKVKI